MAHGPDGGKQRRWLKLILRWQRSQLSVRVFCQRNHLSEASFFSWRRTLRQRGLLEDAAKTSNASSDSPTFVKLTAVDAPQPTSAIELVLSRRRRLRVRPGFDADTLLELLRLLEDAPC